MIRLLAASSVAALILSACAPETAKPGPSAETGEETSADTAGIETAPPVAPEGFELAHKVESENYTVQSEIDPAILEFDPALAWRLWTDAKGQLDDLAASADEGRQMADEDAAATGTKSWFRGYTLEITHKATGVFGDVISVSDMVSTYTGGAHPNYFLAGGIYRKGETGALPLSTFIADAPAFNELAVKALVAEKQERGHTDDPAIIESSLRDVLAPSADIPNIYEGRFVFEPSTETGKVGGISVMFSPYDIGSYAEGAYYATIPAADLAPILTETWTGRFGGEPLLEEQ